MKRPSFQFYPADWRNNANLRRCSKAAQGAWMDILCTLHDSDEYGVVRWPLADLAAAAGVPFRLAKELVEKLVLKGSDSDPVRFVHAPRHAGKDGEPVTLVEATDGPCWFSSRMVKDEWRRSVSGGSTRFGAGNQAEADNKHTKQPRRSPSRRHGYDVGDDLGDGASSSTSASSVEVKSSFHSDNTPPSLPTWVDIEAWDAFMEVRTKRKRPNTARALKIILKKLEKFYASGHDPTAIIDTSTANGWTDIFEPKSDGSYGKRRDKSSAHDNFALGAVAAAIRHPAEDSD